MIFDFICRTDAFRRFLSRLEQNDSRLILSGLVESAKPYFLASLMSRTEKKIIFIRPKSASLSRFADQCRFFLKAFKLEKTALFLPPLHENPYRDIAPSLEAVSSRMEFFHKLTTHPPDLTVTNLPALLKPFPSPNTLPGLFISLEKDLQMDRDDLLGRLHEIGYSREDIINSHGEFAWRGGIVDIYSPWSLHPFRIEFSGDSIASLREFEVHSQRSIRKLGDAVIPSLREFPGSKEFLTQWKDYALVAGKAKVRTDIRDKAESLLEGEIFPSFHFMSLANRSRFVSFDLYFSEDTLLIIDEAEQVEREWLDMVERMDEQFKELETNKRFVLPPDFIYPSSSWEKIENTAHRVNSWGDGGGEEVFDFGFQSVPRFDNKIPFFIEYLKKREKERDRCLIFFSHEGIQKKMSVLLEKNDIPHQIVDTESTVSASSDVRLLKGELAGGFAHLGMKILFFSEQDIFTEERVLVSRSRLRPFTSQFRDLKTDDYVVHTDYGIGQFSGLVKMKVEAKDHDFIKVIYRDGDCLFIPIEDLNLVQKYSHLGAGAPILNKLGTPQWEKIKERTKQAIETMARELLELYAERKSVKGNAFSVSGEWIQDFEKTFEYKETDDQLQAIDEISKDMENDSPMDRLLCGDVGYGKTEVAVRAAFKSVMDGKQAAVLCPTTVLTSQHLKTFRNRMVLFPIRVEALSRLQNRARQKVILQDLEKHQVDIIIGTHRLLSDDVRFRDLGLLIVDEEQRFGVKHKEKIKQWKTNVDVLTMTATPIPRTLNLSLTGLRDISLIETPPKDRLAIHTVVTTFSRELITSAVRKELSRGGQVYFIHNRIEDIESFAQMILKWIPEAKTAVIHGQMSAPELEKRMIEFIEGRTNVLLSTTIIENGIDIPQVNTLIVNRADRFGLAQLYQLRGRVGRSSRQAVAYFLVPSFTGLTPLARERLKALQEFSELGSGFRLAAKDLEIRGAGSFLGARQHGNIESVGFDYYVQLLENTIKRLKGEEEKDVQSRLQLKINIRIPEKYLPQVNLRLNLYKRISSANDPGEIEKIREEVTDRYGPLPPSVENLFKYGSARALARRLMIESIDRIGRKLVFKFFPDSSADLAGLMKLLDSRSGNLTPQGIMSLQLSSQGEGPVLDETLSILNELSHI